MLHIQIVDGKSNVDYNFNIKSSNVVRNTLATDEYNLKQSLIQKKYDNYVKASTELVELISVEINNTLEKFKSIV
jgi:hypothetical protein